MTAPSIIVVGAGGHARACIDVIEMAGSHTIVGLIGMPHEIGTRVDGYEVVGTDEGLRDLKARGAQAAIVGIGQISSPAPRMRLFEKLAGVGYALPTIVSPLAHVSAKAKLGEGTVVMHGAIVGPGARIGRNCIINTGALIEHDTVVADHCHIATRAVLNGGVSVGGGSFIGSASVIREGVRVGSDCIVGMALGVRRDLEDGTRFVGAKHE